MRNNKNVDLHSRLVPIDTCFPLGLSLFGAGEGVGSEERIWEERRDLKKTNDGWGE